jgi:hypothetical protein
MRPLYYLLCLTPDYFILPYARRFYSSGESAATRWVKDIQGASEKSTQLEKVH